MATRGLAGKRGRMDQLSEGQKAFFRKAESIEASQEIPCTTQ